MKRLTILAISFVLIVSGAALCVTDSAVHADDGKWQPAESPLMTRWAKEVSPESVWPEYPRPQLVRKSWQNLNGLWQYAIRKREEPQPGEFDGDILVPFPVESALSGVKRRLGYTQRLWYRRQFEVPSAWRKNDQRVLLNFGAVDWDATVFVNGTKVGRHRGGYDPFTFDITDALRPGDAEQQIVVSVWDGTDTGYQCRGKQTLTTEGVWYTASSGIWQTVWLEPVPASYIESLKIVPDVDRQQVAVTVKGRGERVAIEVRDGDDLIARDEGKPGEAIVLPITDPKLWGPGSPHLYDVVVTLAGDNGSQDRVESYFGMRKIELKKDAAGLLRIYLNDKMLFQYGLLDQGYWPDGLYTPPTDAAMRYDVDATRDLGFNLIRKHVKIEPQRWYTYCDRVGMIVWQDMPNGDRFLNVFKPVPDPDLIRSPESARQFELELTRLIESRGNHPCIVLWSPFNEGWGQYDTARITDLVKKLDPTRLVDSASGLVDRGTGEVNDVHHYLGQSFPLPEEKRAVVMGEFGGLGRRVPGHLWKNEKEWDYRRLDDIDELTDAYVELTKNLQVMYARGLSGAVYTQTTDVEIEVNGHLTYDRALHKLHPEAVRAANRAVYAKPPIVTYLMAGSEHTPQTWRYTTKEPEGTWSAPDFDDGQWQEGPGVLGKLKHFGKRVRTEWQSEAIWLRRSFTLPEKFAGRPHLLVHHSGPCTVTINGVTTRLPEASTAGYRLVPVEGLLAAALRRGKSNSIVVHCRSSDQAHYVDIALVSLTERP
ncbi:MAG: glycoside hydrolase family 2 [Planctomycetota bacterium]|nr:MAG: glycoside hydrolase family 2 [Planctomycetota bacterium]REK38456.1 MAG: glycoside hydrolase family 2 [Planctomycetota bacterium]